MDRRGFVQSAAVVVAGHGLGLSLIPETSVIAASWYAAHCAFCGYEFNSDPHVWSFVMPPGSPPYKLCSVCIWHGPRADSWERRAKLPAL